MLDDYYYVRVYYEKPQKPMDTEGSYGILTGFYLGKGKAKYKRDDKTYERWNGEHHQDYDSMLILVENTDQGVMFDKERIAIDYAFDTLKDKRFRNINRGGGGKPSNPEPNTTSTVYMCLKYRYVLVDLETRSLSLTPEVGPVMEKAVSLLKVVIDGIVQKDNVVKFKLHLREFGKYFIDNKDKGTEYFVLCVITDRCVPKAKRDDQNSTTADYAESLLRTLVTHYTYTEPSRKYPQQVHQGQQNPSEGLHQRGPTFSRALWIECEVKQKSRQTTLEEYWLKQ